MVGECACRVVVEGWERVGGEMQVSRGQWRGGGVEGMGALVRIAPELHRDVTRLCSLCQLFQVDSISYGPAFRYRFSYIQGIPT